MIQNGNGTIVVDGVNTAGCFYKKSEESAPQCNICVSDGAGGYLGGFAYTITDKVAVYVMKRIVLYEEDVYRIAGVATPGDRLIYISAQFDKKNIDVLKNSVIASTYADKDGNFQFDNIAVPHCTLYLWMATLAQDAPTASLTYELSVVGYNSEAETVLTYEFSKSDNEYENPLFTIEGTCSGDITTIYISCVDNTANVVRLKETMCASVVPKNGRFYLKCSGEYDENYVVWCVSQIGGEMAVDNIDVSHDNSTCLSGDTMITMADGSTMRMDSLCAGDVVLSDGAVPSRVHTVRRGKFSDYHTLYHFEDGTVIDETHPHRFYNADQGFWQRLQLWNIGDHAINQRGERVALVHVERIEDEAEMFGIWTDSGTYYANGLLSGAAFCNKELLADASAEQAIDMMLSTDEELLIQLMGLEGGLPL